MNSLLEIPKPITVTLLPFLGRCLEEPCSLPKQLVESQEHRTNLHRKSFADLRTIQGRESREEGSDSGVASDGQLALAFGTNLHRDLANQEPPTTLPNYTCHFTDGLTWDGFGKMFLQYRGKRPAACKPLDHE